MAGGGAGAEIMDNVGAGVENKEYRLRNTARYIHIFLAPAPARSL